MDVTSRAAYSCHGSAIRTRTMQTDSSTGHTVNAHGRRQIIGMHYFVHRKVKHAARRAAQAASHNPLSPRHNWHQYNRHAPSVRMTASRIWQHNVPMVVVDLMVPAAQEVRTWHTRGNSASSCNNARSLPPSGGMSFKRREREDSSTAVSFDVRFSRHDRACARGRKRRGGFSPPLQSEEMAIGAERQGQRAQDAGMAARSGINT